MRRYLILLGSGLLLAGCTAAGPKPGPEQKPLPRPFDLMVEASTDALHLTWHVDRPPGHVFSGYNIYIVERPIVGTPDEADLLKHARPYNQLPFPGDTDADLTKETYTADGLSEGKRYYCFVRALGMDGQLGAPSNQVMAICHPSGRARIQPPFSGDTDGFDFSRGKYTNTDAIDCDLAFYSKGGTDHLIAPARIDPLLNDTRFWDLGKTSDWTSQVEPKLNGDGEDEIDARSQHLYAYRTADGHYGKLWIESIGGSGDQRTVRFLYMYQTIPNLIHLE